MAVDCNRVSLILLAAGRSERFGGNKLVHPLRGRPLVHHIADTLSQIGFKEHIAVVGSADLNITRFGFRPVRSEIDAPMSSSIKNGVVAVDPASAACMIVLADMPLIPKSHFCRLLDSHQGNVTATVSDGVRSVPAIFSRDMFSLLNALTGDRGAASLLSTGTAISGEPEWLKDFDTREDFERLPSTFSTPDDVSR
jgi:molybdenum cofactor cytidylyltransferase